MTNPTKEEWSSICGDDWELFDNDSPQSIPVATYVSGMSVSNNYEQVPGTGARKSASVHNLSKSGKTPNSNKNLKNQKQEEVQNDKKKKRNSSYLVACTKEDRAYERLLNRHGAEYATKMRSRLVSVRAAQEHAKKIKAHVPRVVLRTIENITCQRTLDTAQRKHISECATTLSAVFWKASDPATEVITALNGAIGLIKRWVARYDSHASRLNAHLHKDEKFCLSVRLLSAMGYPYGMKNGKFPSYSDEELPYIFATRRIKMPQGWDDVIAIVCSVALIAGRDVIQRAVDEVARAALTTAHALVHPVETMTNLAGEAVFRAGVVAAQRAQNSDVVHEVVREVVAEAVKEVHHTAARATDGLIARIKQSLIDALTKIAAYIGRFFTDPIGTASTLIEDTFKMIKSAMHTIARHTYGDLGPRFSRSFLPLMALIVYFVARRVGVALKSWLEVLLRAPYADLRALARMVGLLSEPEQPEDQGFSDTLSEIFSDEFGLSDFPFAFEKFTRFGRSVEWFFTRMEKIFAWITMKVTGIPVPTTDADNELFTFVKAVDALEMRAAAMSLGQRTTQTSFVRDVKALDTEWSTTLKNVLSRKDVSRSFSQLALKAREKLLALLKPILHAESVVKPRPIPFWVYIRGPPGVGKSASVRSLLKKIKEGLSLRHPDLFEDPEFTENDYYSKQQTDAFWDGYKGEPFVLIDDIFQMLDVKLRASMATQLIDMVSMNRLSLLTAQPEEKGKNLFCSRLILSTSNADPSDLHNLGIEDPDALTSRMGLIVSLGRAGVFTVENATIMQGGNTMRTLSIDYLAQVCIHALEEREKQVREAASDAYVPILGLSYTGPRHFSFDARVPDASAPPVIVPDDPDSSESEDQVLDIPGLARSLTPSRVVDFVVERAAKHTLTAQVLEIFVKRTTTIEVSYGVLPSITARDGAVYITLSETMHDQNSRYYTMLMLIAWYQRREEHSVEVMERAVAVLLSSVFAAMAGATALAIGAFAFSRVIDPVDQSEEDIYNRQHDYEEKEKKRIEEEERKAALKEEREARNASYRSYQETPQYPHGDPDDHGDGELGPVELKILANLQSMVISFRSDEERSSSRTWVLFVGGAYGLIPEHTFKGSTPLFVTLGVFGDTSNKVFDWKDLGARKVGPDLVMLCFPGLPMRANITQHFASIKEIDKSREVYRLEKHAKEKRNEISVKRTYVAKFKGHIGRPAHDYEIPNTENARGYCMYPYVVMANGPKVFALHIAGVQTARVSYAMRLDKEILDTILSGLTLTEVVGRLPVASPSSVELPGTTTLGAVSPQGATYVGTKTQFRPSILQDPSNAHLWPFPPTGKAPARLVPFATSEGTVSPLWKATDKYKVYVPPFPFGLLAHVKYECLVPASFVHRRLTIEEAIYGDGDVVPALDLSTSSGYFYKKARLSRRDLCYDANGRRLHPTLSRDVEYILSEWAKGNIVPMVAEDALKDELRDIERVEAGKTRLFCVGDFAYLIATKMVTGSLCIAVESDPTQLPVSVGINPHSHDWSMLQKRLKRWPDVIAGDFSSYDFSIPYNVFEHMGEWLSRRTGDPGYSIVFRSMGMTDHIVGKHVYRTDQGTPSGHYLTSVANSMANYAIHAMAFFHLNQKPFDQYTESTFYGDDSIVTFDKSRVVFDMNTLSTTLDDLFGMTYTSYDKKTAMEYASWDDVTFLKRRFLEIDGRTQAALEQASIQNIMLWYRDGLDIPEVWSNKMDAVALEAWHHGKETYIKYVVMLMSVRDKLAPSWTSISYADFTARKSPDYLTDLSCKPWWSRPAQVRGSVPNVRNGDPEWWETEWEQ